MTELEAALRERLEIIGDEESRRLPEQHLERLQRVSERIENLEQELPAQTDPQLRHYLQRRSYTKALEHLTASAVTTRGRLNPRERPARGGI
jgi:predicted metal-dependent hydrolase